MPLAPLAQVFPNAMRSNWRRLSHAWILPSAPRCRSPGSTVSVSSMVSDGGWIKDPESSRHEMFGILCFLFLFFLSLSGRVCLSPRFFLRPFTSLE